MKLHKVTLYITSYSMNPTETTYCIRDNIFLTYFISVCLGEHDRVASYFYRFVIVVMYMYTFNLSTDIYLR